MSAPDLMRDNAHHVAHVDAWIEQTAKGASREERVKLFEAAVGVLWAQTQTTLGDVTLTAIADRVLSTAAEKFPVLAVLTVEPKTGIQCASLLEPFDSAHAAELEEGIRFVLVEFLTVLGSLTAEILTPELHAELSKVGSAKVAQPATDPRGQGTAAAERRDGKS